VPLNRRSYKLIRRLLPFIGLIVLAYILLTQVDFSEVARIFASLNPWYCALALFACVPILLLVNLEWQLLLRQQGFHVTYTYSMKNLLIGFFYGFITPGGIGGYLQTVYLKQESGQPLPKCASNIITLHTIDLITLLGFAVLGGILLGGHFPLFLILFVALFIFIIALFILYLNQDTSSALLQWLFKTRIMQVIQHQFEDPLESFFEQLPRLRALILPFILSILGWLVSFTELYLISRLFAIDVPYLPFILMIAMANVIALLPISIYGIGTREATLITLFAVYLVPSEQIVSLSLFWFALVWLIPSLAGAVVTFLEHKRLALLRIQYNEEEKEQR
jgi:hypothetical protein